MESGGPSVIASSPVDLVPPASAPLRRRLVVAGAPAAADGDQAPAELEPLQAVSAEAQRPRMDSESTRRPPAVHASRAASAAKPIGWKKAAPPQAKKLAPSDASAHLRPPPPPVRVLPASSVDSAMEDAHDLFGTMPASNMIKRAERPGFSSIGSRVTVLVNRYITFCCPETIINMYKISVTPETRSRCIKEALVEELVKMSLGNKVIAFDGTHIYTITPFSFELEEEFAIKLNEGACEGALRVSYSIAIHFAKSLKMQELVEYYDGERSDVSQDTLHAINVVVRALFSSCLNAPRTFFSTKFGPIIDTKEGLELWQGCYKGVCLSQYGLDLTIDTTVAPFYKPISVVKFVSEFLGRTDLSRPLSHKEYAKIEIALKGIQVETIHQPDKIMKYRIKGLTVVPLKELMFSVGDEDIMTTIADYYQSRYNRNLEYIHWPCLQCGVSGREIFLPMEVCKVMQGQRYRQKLSTTQAAKLLKVTCKRPQTRLKGIMKAAKGNFDLGDLTEGEVSASGFPKMLYGSVLPTPLLKYGNEENFMPTGGRWNMVNKKLIDGGKVERWACLNFSKVPALKVESFCAQLINMCNDMGMVFEGQELTLPHSTKFMDIQSILEALHSHTSELFAQQGRHQRLQLLIVILPEEKGHYGTIKRICETQLGIVSQCCLPKHVKEHANVEYLENVALKINVKAGGRNAILQEGLPFLSESPTIIFGADVSHPSPGVYSPSISAVVASMDWPEVATYRCVISAQLPKQEIINFLFQVTQDTNGCMKTASMIKELLLNFYQKNHRKPERIIFYRDGVSESQFSQVLLHEVDAIRKACMSLDEHYLPPITFVVVQKRHQTRLFPFATTRDPEPKGILPGTVVDYGICDPWGFDFYLSSHASEGSCRPTHYNVLFDENHFTPGALQSITYNLCYIYARCTRSVSIVAPVYYAHLAASRGRSYQGNFGDGSSIRETTPSDELPEFLQVPKIDGNVSEVMFYC
uniref:Uncharacterized protein n=1 Tax=Avena sativa TaxID=4498 RepID=A0ACD5UBX9_AVESA